MKIYLRKVIASISNLNLENNMFDLESQLNMGFVDLKTGLYHDMILEMKHEGDKLIQKEVNNEMCYDDLLEI